MSYGVWRRHGKGWSSIEIDSPWNYDMFNLQSYNEAAYERLIKRPDVDYSDNPHEIQWSDTQKRKGWAIEEMPTGGEHVLYIAYKDIESRERAIQKMKDFFWYEKFLEQNKEGFLVSWTQSN